MTVGELLWTPPGDALERTRVGDFIRFLERTRGLRLTGYAQLWQWSVDDLAGFWSAVWDYFDVIAHAAPTSVLADPTMPGARWFEGATLNYAENVLRMPGLADNDPVVVAYSQSRPDRPLSAAELREHGRRV